MNINNLLLSVVFLLISLIKSAGQELWMPKRTRNVSIDDSLFYRSYLIRGFLELRNNERDYTLNNIAANYAHVYASPDTVFRYLNLSIEHYPQEECWLLFDSLQHNKFVKAAHDLYSEIDKMSYEMVRRKCDSILSLINKDLQSKLLTMSVNDQEIRSHLDSLYGSRQFDKKNIKALQLWSIQNKRDSLNQHELELIINKFGYPGKTLVGPNICNVGFDIILHAPQTYQEKYLHLIEDASTKNELDKRCYPFLVDRILMNKGKRQIYGTQFKYNNISMKLELYPIEDAKNLNQRRSIYHLPPLKEDVNYINEMEKNSDK